MLIHTLPLPDSLGSCSTKHTNSSPTEEEEKKISQKISSKTYVTYKCSYPDTCRPVSLPCVYISLTCLSCTFCLFSFPPLVASLPLSPSLSAPTLGLALWLWESQISAPSGCRRYHQMPLLTPYLSLMHFPDVCQAAMHTYDIPTPHSQQYNSFVKTLNN